MYVLSYCIYITIDQFIVSLILIFKKTVELILSYITHMTPWNFLQWAHTGSIVQNSRAQLTYQYLPISIYQLIYNVLQPYI